ncbi:nuclear transcription factor Y subunit A-9-like [Bidens hawaiensis]|uniref:nuclear transcription factor Y subunit A-9-like n=1 Tax=Bidens hawaiensis TaxID=980011 RepID=UPI0040490569
MNECAIVILLLHNMSFSNTIMPSLFGSSSQNNSPDQESLSGFPLNEEDKCSIFYISWLDLYGQQQYFNKSYHQHALPNMLPANSEIQNWVPQIDFFGHNIGCSQYPYYGGMTTTYSPLMISPHSMDAPTRLPLAPEIGPGPVFVNAKQYHAIFRCKAPNPPYIHESRHQHAMKKPRGTGGRFALSEEIDSLKTATSDSPKHVRPGSSKSPRGESSNS